MSKQDPSAFIDLEGNVSMLPLALESTAHVYHRQHDDAHNRGEDSDLQALIELKDKLTLSGNVSFMMQFQDPVVQSNFEKFCSSDKETSVLLLLMLLIYMTGTYTMGLLVCLIDPEADKSPVFAILYGTRLIILWPCWAVFFKMQKYDFASSFTWNKSSTFLANIFIVLHSIISFFVYIALSRAGINLCYQLYFC